MLSGICCYGGGLGRVKLAGYQVLYIRTEVTQDVVDQVSRVVLVAQTIAVAPGNVSSMSLFPRN